MKLNDFSQLADALKKCEGCEVNDKQSNDKLCEVCRKERNNISIKPTGMAELFQFVNEEFRKINEIK